jgi:two-component system, NtrC family, sensor kinase
VIQLDNSGHLRIAGASGFSAEEMESLQRQTRHSPTEAIKERCSAGRKVGNSYQCSAQAGAKLDNSTGWNLGDEVLIPLSSAHGASLGCISLREPRDPEAINSDELSRIELLAADLAVALELKSLQNQLIRSEKLAALGQLVAGVAHELNNPLTSVLGYGELLAEDITSGPLRKRLDKLVSEGHRMRKIVENLLRFSRQKAADRQSVDLASAIQDVLSLREYYLRKQGLDVALDVRSDLPRVALAENEFKQVLLNLLNNAIDAMEADSGPKQISLRAFQRGERAVVELEDSGPGFADLNRALDPFYTTKPVGKGTGLGLSICYGIIREHDGDIKLENLKPRGAKVTLELPLGEPEPVPLKALAARMT